MRREEEEEDFAPHIISLTGKDNIPLLTISAIIKTATSSQESVLYLIFGGGRSQSRASKINHGKKEKEYRMPRLSISAEKSRFNHRHRVPPHGQKHLYRHNLLLHAASLHPRETATRLTSPTFPTLSNRKRRSQLSRKNREQHFTFYMQIMPQC